MKQIAAYTNSVEHVTEKILRIAQTGISASQRTCYHQVGLYLFKHPLTKGKILMYDQTGEKPYYVAHAILLDTNGKILVDTYKAPQDDYTVYRRHDSDQVGVYKLCATLIVNGNESIVEASVTASADPWFDEPRTDQYSERLGLATNGDYIKWWLKANRVAKQGSKYVFYHATPKTNTFTELKEGSLLEVDKDTAIHFAGRDRRLKPSQIKVYKLLLTEHDIFAAQWASLRRSISVSRLELAASKPMLAGARDFEFNVIIEEGNGKHGVFKKTVEAKSLDKAWKLLVDQLKTMTILHSVRKIEYIAAGI